MKTLYRTMYFSLLMFHLNSFAGQPAAPSNISHHYTLDTANIGLTWHEYSHDQDGFKIYRKTLTSPQFELLISLPFGSYSGDIFRFEDGTIPTITESLVYGISAYNSSGESAIVQQQVDLDVLVPAPVVQYDFLDDTTVQLVIDNVNLNGTRYGLYTEINGIEQECTGTIYNLSATEWQYIDYDSWNGKEYHVRVWNAWTGGETLVQVINASNSDLNCPTISLLPSTGSVITSNYISLYGYAEDAESGINQDSIELYFDGAPVSVTWSWDYFGAYSSSVYTNDGWHSVSVYVRDNAGNSTTIDSYFFVDSSPPVFSYQVPQNTTPDFQPIIGGRYNDDGYGSGINSNSILMYLDGSPVTPWYVDEQCAYYFPDQTLPDGVHNVTMMIQDNVGNWGYTSWSFSINSIGPIVHIEPTYGVTPVTWSATVWQNRVDVTSNYSLVWNSALSNGQYPSAPHFGREFDFVPTISVSAVFNVAVEATIVGGETLTSTQGVVVYHDSETGEDKTEPTTTTPPAVKVLSLEISNGRGTSSDEGGHTFKGLLVDVKINTDVKAGQNPPGTYRAIESLERTEETHGIFLETDPGPGSPNNADQSFPETNSDVHDIKIDFIEHILDTTSTLQNYAVKGSNSFEHRQIHEYKTGAFLAGYKSIPKSGFKIKFVLDRIDANTAEFKVTKTPASVTMNDGKFSIAGLGGEKSATFTISKDGTKWKWVLKGIVP